MTEKKETLSTSKIAMRYGLDRGTVSKRLEAAKIKPVSEKAKEKLYEINEKLEKALIGQAKPLEAAKLRKENAAAEITEFKLKQMTGEVFPVADFIAAVQSIFGNLHKKCCVHLPKTLAKKLKKAKSEAEIARIIEKDIAAVFNELRVNHKKFLDKNLLNE